MSVNTKHKDYDSMVKIITKVRDACAGEDVIKSKSTTYLPKPEGMSEVSYNNYKKRAMYPNFCGKVLNVAVSQIFRKEPEVTDLYDDSLLEDIDAKGQSLSSLSRVVVKELLQTNRVGAFVDYNGKQPYLTLYKAENIINWRIEDNKLVLVVIEGNIEVVNPEDPYSTLNKPVWREMYLDENEIFQVRDWEEYKDKNGELNYRVYDEYTPIRNDAEFDYIPFYFFTNIGDTTEINNPILLDLANVNLAYYNNSADYENLVHWTGCKTIITIGRGDVDFQVGGAIDLPQGGNAFFLEASSDSALENAMKTKQEIMGVLGNGIISGRGRYVASAETSKTNAESDWASLADIANAVSDVMSALLTECNYWNNDSRNATIKFNTVYSEDEIQDEVIAISK